MKEISSPLDHLIELCEKAIDYETITKFTVLNAKDELKRLRQATSNPSINCEDDNTNRWLSCEKELCQLKEKIKMIFNKPVAYGLINDRYDLYDLRLQNNPCNDQTNVVPLYSNKQDLIEWLNQKKI
jgi:hypothetical protein